MREGNEGFRRCSISRCHWISWQPLSVQCMGACAPRPLCCLRDEASPELYFETSGIKWVPRTNGAALQRMLSPPLVSFEVQARIKAFCVFCSVACRGLGEGQVLSSALACENLAQCACWVAVHYRDLPSKGHCSCSVRLHTNEVWHFPGNRPAAGRVMLPTYHLPVLPFHLKPVKCWSHTENWLFLFKLQDAKRRCHHVNVKQDTWEGWAETAWAQNDRLICHWRRDSGNVAPPKTSEWEERSPRKHTKERWELRAMVTWDKWQISGSLTL